MIKFLNRHRGVRGSVTILMLIIMLPMLVFSFTLVDICKIYMAMDVTADATQLALNAGMTSYDKVLKDMYGILATSKTEEELSEKMSKYYAATLAATGISDSEIDVEHLVTQILGSIDGIDTSAFKNNNSYLSVMPEKVSGSDFYLSVNAFDSSAVSNPTVLERQIVEYMKYRGPMKMAEGILEKINILKDLPAQSKVVTNRMEFEQKLGDINNDAIDIYTLFQLYFYNNERAENGNTQFSIVYESEKTKLIKEYKYMGSQIKAGSLFSENEELKKIECQLKSASILLMIYAPFYDRMKNNTTMKTYEFGSNHESASKLADNLDTYASTLENVDFPGNYSLEDAMEAIKNGESYAKEASQFSSDNWVSDIDTDIEIAIENAFKLSCAIQGFAKTFSGGRGKESTNDIFNAVKEFKTAYERAEVLAKDKNTSDDDKKALNSALKKVEDLYDDIDETLDKFKTLIPKLSEMANQRFKQAVNKLKALYDFADKQVKILERLSDNGDISKLVDKFKKAKEFAINDYQPSITAVSSENQQNSAQQTYDREAKNIEELSKEDADNLVAELKRQKEYYVKLREALLDIRVVSEYEETVTVLDKNGSAKDKIEKYFTDGLLDKVSPSLGKWGYLFDLPDYKHKDDNLGLKSWTVNNESKAILDNSIYKQVVKMSVPKDGKKKDKEAENTKTTIMNNSKISGTGEGDEKMPVKVDSVTEDKPSEEEKAAFKEMASAEKFSEYIKKSEEANSILRQTATLPDEKNKVDATCNTTGDNNAVAKNATNMINSVSTIMGELGNSLAKGGESIRDAFLVTEYLTNNFSCHTTSMDGTGKRKNDEKMLSGMLFYSKDGDGKVEKNIGYGSELEYILYGHDNELANKASAGGIIFGIRFVLNLIYSFTDAEIRSFTFTIASGAAGWFPFAVPIVQTVLHIGLALAESAIDLTELMRGASVPIYKSPTTWRCKGSNIVRAAVAEVVKTVGNVALDAASDALCNAISSAEGTINEKSKEVTEYVSEQIKAYNDQIKDAIMSPIEGVIQQCMLEKDDLMSEGEAKAKEKIKDMLDGAVANLTKSLNSQAEESEGENLINKAEKDIVSSIDTKAITDTIFNNLDSFINASSVGSDENDSVDNALNKLKTTVEEKLKYVIDKINAKCEDIRKQLDEKITSAVTKVSGELQKGVKNTAEEIKEKLNAKVTSAVTGHKNMNIIDAKGKTSSVRENLLSMNYKEYLYIFTLIGLAANHDAMLERAALLMQANCKARGADANSGDTYTLNQTRTFFEATAGASTKTVFYGAVFKNRKLDMSAARKKYEFTYSAYMGY